MKTLDANVFVPILTHGNVATLVDTNETRVRRWSSGKNPAVQRGQKAGRSRLTVPFVGLVEADVIQHLMASGFSSRRAGSLIRGMRSEHGKSALVEKPELVTDGASMFIREGSDLERTHDSQMAHHGVLEDFLRHLKIENGRVVEFSPDRMKFTSVNPDFNGGALSLTDSRVPLFALVSDLRGGELPVSVAKDYRVSIEQVEAIYDNLDWAEQAA